MVESEVRQLHTLFYETLCILMKIFNDFYPYILKDDASSSHGINRQVKSVGVHFRVKLLRFRGGIVNQP